MSIMDLPNAMKAWRFSSIAGGLEKNLKLHADAPLPKSASSLGKDQVLVKVSAAAINPVDYKLAELPYISSFIIKRPASPGLDCAGTIVAAGSDCGDLKPGQRVFGRLEGPQQFGTLGEYVVVPKSGTAPLPAGVSMEDAACIGTAALTAYQAIAPNVKKGDNVFVNGGSGGTGIFSIQVAKALDCYVTTTCSTPNVGLCQDLGADLVIDYKKSSIVEELRKSGRQYDLIVDNVGTTQRCIGRAGSTQGLVRSTSKSAWNRRAYWTSASDTYGRVSSEDQGYSYGFMMVKNDQQHFRHHGDWMKEGKMKAVKDSVFAYDDAPKAFEKLKVGRTRGKIVIKGVTE